MANKIQKRTTITNDIFAELEKKYPLKSEKSGVCYTQSMDYITLEVETFNNSIFRKLVKQDSSVLVVYMYLRERMCHNGWNLLWDNDTIDDIWERLGLWGIKEENCKPYVDLLLEKGMLYKIERDGKEYLTDSQQIFNWEMLQAKRARDRKSKQNNSTNDSQNGSDSNDKKEPQSNDNNASPTTNQTQSLPNQSDVLLPPPGFVEILDSNLPFQK